MAEHETIADIIAEKRRQADKIERDVDEKMKRNKMISDCYARELVADIRREADRLDAAHRRERGDAAKLREALVQAELFVGNIVRHGHQTLVPGDKCTACDGAEELRDMICAALAESPRNCDRFATVDEARKAHEAICEKYGKCHNGCPLNNEEHYSAFDCFEAWLFAPATEKEGGAK